MSEGYTKVEDEFSTKFEQAARVSQSDQADMVLEATSVFLLVSQYLTFLEWKIALVLTR